MYCPSCLSILSVHHTVLRSSAQLQELQLLDINPLAPNNHCTGRYYTHTHTQVSNDQCTVESLLKPRSPEEKCCLLKFINTMPSVLLLFLDQNEGFAKSQVHKNRAVIDAILQFSHGMEPFKGVSFSCLLTSETYTQLQKATG